MSWCYTINDFLLLQHTLRQRWRVAPSGQRQQLEDINVVCFLQHGNYSTGASCQKSAVKTSTTDIPEMPPCDFKPEEFKVKICLSIRPSIRVVVFPSWVSSLSRECPKIECWRSDSRIVSPWPWESPTIRNRYSSTRVTCSGCGMWTGNDTWICLPVWLPSAWATVTRKVLSCMAVRGPGRSRTVALTVYICVWRYRKVTAAAERQLRRLWHTTNIYVYPTLHEYCEKLTSYLPDPLKVRRESPFSLFWLGRGCDNAGWCFSKVVYLTNSGSEANDLAVMLARLHTGNFDVITLRYDLFLFKTEEQQAP